MNEWTKTFLTVYDKIDRMVKAVGDCLTCRATGSFWSSSSMSSTADLCDEIIEINYRKNKLVNLKKLIREGLETLTQAEREMLILRYVKNISAAEISEAYDIPVRTVYRRIERALQNFTYYFSKQGCDESWCEKYFGTEPLVTKAKKRLQNSEGDSPEVKILKSEVRARLEADKQY